MYMLLFEKVPCGFLKILLIGAFAYSYSKIFYKDLFNQAFANTVILLILGYVIISR